MSKKSNNKAKKPQESLYVAQMITGMRIRKECLEFQVKWSGFEQKTWEPEGNTDIRQMIEEYLRIMTGSSKAIPADFRLEKK